MSSLVELITSVGQLAAFPITMSKYKNDRKLIYVNNTFCTLTGYTADECLDKNCRFLQGPDTEEDAINAIRHAFAEKITIFQDLLNYKKNGEAFINRLVLLTFDYDHEKYILGLQHVVEKVSENKYHYSELNDKLLNPIASLLLYAENSTQINADTKEKFLDRLNYISKFIINL